MEISFVAVNLRGNSLPRYITIKSFEPFGAIFQATDCEFTLSANVRVSIVTVCFFPAMVQWPLAGMTFTNGAPQSARVSGSAANETTRRTATAARMGTTTLFTAQFSQA